MNIEISISEFDHFTYKDFANIKSSLSEFNKAILSLLVVEVVVNSEDALHSDGKAF